MLGYSVNLNERGSFFADVRDINDTTLLSIHSNDEGGIDLIEDGYMKHAEDVNGLTDYVNTVMGIPGTVVPLADMEAFVANTQRLALDAIHWDGVKTGAKTNTIRPSQRSIATGPLLFVDPVTSALLRVDVDDVVWTRFCDLDADTLRENGYDTLQAFLEDMHAYYPTLQATDTCTVVSFSYS